MKIAVLIVGLIVVGITIFNVGMQYADMQHHVITKMVVKVPGASIDVSDKDSWNTVFKAITAILGVYTGIRLINKLIVIDNK